MSFDKSGLDSYVDVASRMSQFFAKHPDGALQPVDPAKPFEVTTIGDKAFVVYTAAAYRTPDDPRPGIGVAWEPFPGRTPYTRDSEVMNAETSAWGRAILAVGAADTRKGIASAEEVRNRREDREAAVYDPMNPAAIKRQAREEFEKARQAVIGKATAAIEAAETTEALDVVAKRITEVTDKGLITPNDAVSLRQKLVAKREVIAGMSEQEGPE
jgi:ribosomal protein S20